jgi:hypothetical protein
MTTFCCLRFEIPPTWRVRSPYLYPPGTEWPGYIPRHWVLFSSPPTTRRTTMAVFEPASTWDFECIFNLSLYSVKLGRYSDGRLAVLSGFDSRQCRSFQYSVQTGCGAHLASYTMATGVNAQEREAHHSPPSDAETKKGWAIPPLPPYVFMA